MAREKNSFTYNYDTNAIERHGIAYPLGSLSKEDQQHLMMRGLAAWLASQDDPSAAYSAAKDGSKPIRRGHGGVERAWREAAAIVHAEATVKGRIKAGEIVGKPGQKVRDHADFLVQLAEARKMAAAWTKDQLAQAKTHPQVVAEHNALTGTSGDLGALFEPTAQRGEPDDVGADNGVDGMAEAA